jgi:hypothetical protein
MPPLRFAEDQQGMSCRRNIPPILAAQSAFPSGPLMSFYLKLD